MSIISDSLSKVLLENLVGLGIVTSMFGYKIFYILYFIYEYEQVSSGWRNLAQREYYFTYEGNKYKYDSCSFAARTNVEKN